MAKKYGEQTNKRVQDFIAAFSKENRDVRDELANQLPFYNELLNMHALSFDEFALLPIAKARGINIEDPLFRYDSILPPCPRCGEESKVRHGSEGDFICSSCHLKFVANWQSISFGSKCSSLVWLKLLHCLIDGYSVEKTITYCGISRKTYYNLRTKIFYAMQLMMSEVKLYGHIEADNTFVHTSYKGSNLNDPDVPEGSVFDVVNFVPRSPYHRGGSRKISERGVNDVCIFVIADDRGHVAANFVGLGAATGKLLQRAVGNERILSTVPKEDPFPLFGSSKGSRMPTSAPGDISLLISDKEPAIEKFAKLYGIAHESHQYRRNNTQLRLSANAHHIQQINNVHSRLKSFLWKHSFVSTKSLPAYLVLFEFLMNTNASPQAVSELFCILAKPGLGRTKEFYDNLLTVPNYMTQWLESDNPLKHLPYNQILAFHLYDERMKKLAAGETEVITVAEIAERCSCAPSTVRRYYKNLKASGFELVIREHFKEVSTVGGNPTKPPAKNISAVYTPEALAIYDEYEELKKIPQRYRPPFEEFATKMNQKYGTNYTPRALRHLFNFARKKGLRGKVVASTGPREAAPHKIEYLSMYREYIAIKRKYATAGEKAPANHVIRNMLAEKHNLSPERIHSMLQGASYVLAEIRKGQLLCPDGFDIKDF